MSGKSASPLPSRRFSTQDVPQHQKFDMWRSTVQQIHDLEPVGKGQETAFEADVTAWSLGPLAVAGGYFTERRMLRGDRITRRLQIDHYRILLPLGGTTVRHVAGDRRQTVSTGQILFSDLSRAEEADCGTGDLMQFIIARDSLDQLLPRSPDLHGLVPQGPLASLVTDHLTAMVRRLPQFDMADAQVAAMATLHLIAATVRPDETVAEHRPAVETALRRRVLRHVEANLLDPALSQDVLCRTFGLSRASLYRLFQQLGGVASYIQDRKLRRIHQELAGPGPHHLGEISWRYGFSSQAQMSRAFRARFGHAPRDTESGQTAAPVQHAEERLLSFGDILRQLED